MARGKQRKGEQVDRPGLSDPTAPINGGELLTAARPVLVLLREDLGRRAEDTAVERALLVRYEGDKKTNRTADSFNEWRDGLLAQVAASWFLSCVFVRTLEDRGLLGQARLAGPGATDSQTLFFRLAPSLTERDYLLFVFRELAELPAARALFDREHALVWQLLPSADAAKELLRLFRTPSADTPAFRFGQASTRFLGDLYQDLYEDVRKRFALLQTPDFIESFILDRTLEPAIERFGLDDTTLIDPTCGSGHFLLGAFARLFDHRLRALPSTDVGQAAHKALDAVFGADINPYAVAIARVRLTLAYLDKAGIRRLKDAPELPLHLVVADSLLHNPQHAQLDLEHQAGQASADWRSEAFRLEDDDAARDVLHRQYAAVVGNPPYITPKDAATSKRYAAAYASAFRKYSLAVPFCERFFQLARDRGSVGQITANSFMKREFGKKLVEDFLPSVNLELIVNTSGAYIPGHGTPTVLLFGTHEAPVNREVLAVLAKRGEPSTPPDPANGAVWSSVVQHWREIGFDNDYITVANADREHLASHPWSLGGGGALELKELLEERAVSTLATHVDSIGVDTITRAADLLELTRNCFERLGVEAEALLPCQIGEEIRDWAADTGTQIPVPYDRETWALRDIDSFPGLGRFLWPHRTWLRDRFVSGGTRMSDVGLPFWAIPQFPAHKHKTLLSITFAFVATHNHFVLDRGGKVFKQSAPIIKLPATSTEDDHLALLAYLNSSTACFWMKQIFHDKGSGTDTGKWQDDPAKIAYEFAGTGLESLPLPPFTDASKARLIALATLARNLAEQRRRVPYEASARIAAMNGSDQTELRTNFEALDNSLEERLIGIQEQIDWIVYNAYDLVGLVPDRESTAIPLGGRPFEVLAAQRGQTIGTDGQPLQLSPPPGADAALWTAQMETISGSPELSLIESPDYKRRWAITPKDLGGRVLTLHDRIQETCLALLEERVERHLSDFAGPVSRKVIVEAALRAGDIVSLSRWLLLDVPSAVQAALRENAVPHLAIARFKEPGIAKHATWRECWEAQRRQDSGEAVVIEPPSKYGSGDYTTGRYWELRGKLDVPKERFISYPGCESDEDGEPVYGWAGWNHLQRAQALASLYQKRKTEEGWTAGRLTPILAGLLELLPWIKQWHNEPDAEFNGLRMGDSYSLFLDGECQTLGLTHADLEAWRPTKKPPSRKKPAPPPTSPTGDPPPKKGRKRKAESAPRTDETDA